jgi:hypothetical protein
LIFFVRCSEGCKRYLQASTTPKDTDYRVKKDDPGSG